jgi:7-cyano-7-deazaguanine reductase
MTMLDSTLAPEASELGKKSVYTASYEPEKLFPIARKTKRVDIGITTEKLPFYGFDYWNHYEVSWLNEKGKPIAALADIIYPCDTPNIVESKSLKLYFNSFNNSKFPNADTVTAIVKQDLQQRIGAEVFVNILPLAECKEEKLLPGFTGICLDHLDIECNEYIVNPNLLQIENEIATEVLYSDLLKSNCLVTGQPDWGSIQIAYKGKKINHASLLQYIVSFRNHTEFGEHCIERVFMDIMKHCKPKELTVYGRYTRRGGLDINPCRSTHPITHVGKNQRFCRQ